MPPTWRYESLARRAGCARVAGLDEAGRGCLAGPVVAAAVILDPARPVNGVDDSKILSPERRDQLYELIRSRAVAWAVASSQPREIERVNILQATIRAMGRAVRSLSPGPDFLIVDAVRLDHLGLPCRALIRGDSLSVSVAAASIMAKVTRDRLMVEADQLYPGYGFARHKGYPTPGHKAAISKLGATVIHRATFRGVRQEASVLPLSD